VYERFFSLRERPFALSPDPDYLYRSRVHSEALSYLRYGIEGHAGFIVITGEIGSGKTTLLQTALRGVDKHTAVARVVNTQLDARDLLEAVMLDFGLTPEAGLSKPRLLRVLAEYLVQQRVNGRLALLVIDEAQNLSLAALEEVRMLSNLETEKSKLIQIALVGQPELRAMMNRPELEQLRQRVTVSYHLPALDADETAAYINHRLARAATGTPLEFPAEVSSVVHHMSRGVPRRINVIADAILLYAYGEGQREITRDLADKAIDELKASGILTEDAPVAAPSDRVAAASTAPVLTAPGAPGAVSGANAPTAPHALGTPTAPSALSAPSAPTTVTAPVAASAPSASGGGALSVELIARQERMLTALQRLLAEQNHLLQEHRQQLAALVDRASRPAAPAAAPAPAPAPAAAHTPVAAAPQPVETKASVAPTPHQTRSSVTAAPWSMSVAAQRPLHSTQAIVETPGFWSRLGRGFVNTFSLAYKD
jgi:general secretion pathway protein A